MLGMLGLMPLLYVFYMFLPLAPAVYLFLRWRMGRDHLGADPELGQKVIGHYFMALSLQLFLVGLLLILFGLMKGHSADEWKTGQALFASGLLIFIAHLAIVRKKFSGGADYLVHRVFQAFNLVIAGLLGMVSLVLALVFMLHKKCDDLHLALAGLITFGLAWIVLSYCFFRTRAQRLISPTRQAAAGQESPGA